MNEVLAGIIESREVTDGSRTYPLGHYHMDAQEGQVLQSAILEVKPSVSLEVGMAFGISTLYICEALSTLEGRTPKHIAIDPFQFEDWHGVGMRNVQAAGYDRLVEFLQERSEFALPRLLAEGVVLDFALIDGWHSFDQALLEFYYINRMLRVGGIVVFDDADWPMLQRLMRYVHAYPCYELVNAPDGAHATMLGRVRQRVTTTEALAGVFSDSFTRRPWELGIATSCVAFRKVGEDSREMRWVTDF